jgi:hypothetical protein
MITDQTLFDLKTRCPSCRVFARPLARFCTRCGKAFRSDRAADAALQIPLGAGERTKEIAFKEIHATDNILIQTANSTYRFSVTDPQRRRGFLSGGALPGDLEDATLVGVLIENNHGFQSDMSRLRTDSCALFFIREGSGFKRLTTSLITSLVHIKGDKAQTPSLS